MKPKAMIALTALCVGSTVATFAPSSAAAMGLTVLDLEDPGELRWWNRVLDLNTKVINTISDFDVLSDFGKTQFDGPLDADGGGPFPGGFFNWTTFDSNLHPHGGDGLAGRGAGGLGLLALGPSSGWGNTSNALLPNFAEDSLDIYANQSRLGRTAFELELLSIGGSGRVDLTVWNERGRRRIVRDLPAGPEGHRYGVIWLVPGQYTGADIERMNVYDPSGGYEGLSSISELMTPPAPGTIAGMGLAGMFGRRSRRRS